MRVRPPGPPSAGHLGLLFAERCSGPRLDEIPGLGTRTSLSCRIQCSDRERRESSGVSAACGDGDTADATRQGSLFTKLIADARCREAVTDWDSWPQDAVVLERYGQVQLLVAPALLASSWPHVYRCGSCARAAIRLPLLGSRASRLSAASGTLCRPGFGDLRSIRVDRAP